MSQPNGSIRCNVLVSDALSHKVFFPYPLNLFGVGRFRHHGSDPLRVPERPYGQLVQDANLGVYIHIIELVWLFLVAERISLWGFR